MSKSASNLSPKKRNYPAKNYRELLQFRFACGPKLRIARFAVNTAKNDRSLIPSSSSPKITPFSYSYLRTYCKKWIPRGFCHWKLPLSVHCKHYPALILSIYVCSRESHNFTKIPLLLAEAIHVYTYVWVLVRSLCRRKWHEITLQCQLFPGFTQGVYEYKQNAQLVLIQNCQTKVYGGFSARLWYIERKSAKISYWGQSKTKMGIPIFTVYCHGIPLSG